MSQQLIDRIDDMIETIERVVDNIEEGNISFSEAGDFLHGSGDSIVSILQEAKRHVKSKD